LEQTPETSCLHVGNELVVAEGSGACLRLRRFYCRLALFPCIGKPLVNCRGTKVTEFPKKGMTKAGPRRFVQIIGDQVAKAGWKKGLRAFRERREKALESAGVELGRHPRARRTFFRTL